MGIHVDTEKCAGCGSCVEACPFGLISLVEEKAAIREGCNLCGLCRDACSFEAIVIEEAATQSADDSYHGIWVFAEQRGGKLAGVDMELVSKGRELADALHTDLCAVCLGHDVQDTALLISCGADRVYLADDPSLATNDEEILAGELARLIQQHRPGIVLAGATTLGRALIPRVAATLHTGLTADCTGLEIDAESRLLLQTRPAFGGNVMATIVCRARRPQMATVRPRVFKRKPQAGREGQVIRVDFNKESVTSRTRLLDFVEDMSEKVNLEDADIIVAGGRGLGKPENFRLIDELAQVMGAAVGSSRPPVDDGWISYPHQVGQTGKTVAPKLYIACGISGAVQHIAGMQTADVIVAINNDASAPIFEVATYSIIGDLFDVVPLMLKKLGER